MARCGGLPVSLPQLSAGGSFGQASMGGTGGSLSASLSSAALVTHNAGSSSNISTGHALDVSFLLITGANVSQDASITYFPQTDIPAGFFIP